MYRFIITWHALLADLFAKKKEWNKAEKEFILAIELDAKFAYAWDRLGDIHMVTEKYEQAIESYEQALELKKENVGAIFGIAQCYEKLQQWKKAQNYYQQILDKYPKSKLADKAQERLDLLSLNP